MNTRDINEAYRKLSESKSKINETVFGLPESDKEGIHVFAYSPTDANGQYEFLKPCKDGKEYTNEEMWEIVRDLRDELDGPALEFEKQLLTIFKKHGFVFDNGQEIEI